jgi:hypothetical protein
MAVSKVRTSAGTQLYISGTGSAPAAAPAALSTTYDAATFGGASYIQIGELVDLGSFGKKYNLVSFNPLGDRKTVKRRGSYNNGTLSLKLGDSILDNGQIALKAAADQDISYAFKVVLQSGTTYYFTAQVMGWNLEVGSVDQITGLTVDVEIDNDIVTTNQTA